MHVGSSPATIDLTPGATSGALYDGMTSDGGTRLLHDPRRADAPAPTRTPTPAPTSTAPTSAPSSATLTRVSAKPGAGAGGVGDTDACDPPGTTRNEHWNTSTRPPTAAPPRSPAAAGWPPRAATSTSSRPRCSTPPTRATSGAGRSEPLPRRTGPGAALRRDPRVGGRQIDPEPQAAHRERLVRHLRQRDRARPGAERRHPRLRHRHEPARSSGIHAVGSLSSATSPRSAFYEAEEFESPKSLRQIGVDRTTGESSSRRQHLLPLQRERLPP